ncbi:unnamed protein product, partial [Pleuronectes platessa]
IQASLGCKDSGVPGSGQTGHSGLNPASGDKAGHTQTQHAGAVNSPQHLDKWPGFQALGSQALPRKQSRPSAFRLLNSSDCLEGRKAFFPFLSAEEQPSITSQDYIFLFSGSRGGGVRSWVGVKGGRGGRQEDKKGREGATRGEEVKLPRDPDESLETTAGAKPWKQTQISGVGDGKPPPTERRRINSLLF